MKKIMLVLAILVTTPVIFAQKVKLYDPVADAEKELAAVIKKAKEENKFVLIMGGGNWCSWCMEFDRFIKADAQLDSIVKSGFTWYHLNFSKENMNKKTFARLGFPQRFGFPVFMILNGKGERIHTQNSAYLEDGKKSYDKNKVKEFLEMWSPDAFDPGKYEM